MRLPSLLTLFLGFVFQLNAAFVVAPTNFATAEATDGGTAPTHGAGREQNLYSSNHFPVTPILITEIRLRPDTVNLGGNAFSNTISNLRVQMSTTTVAPDGQSATFSANFGTNNTVVFQGSISLTSQFSGPPGGPKEFDIAIPLTTPFSYDRTKGNLLVDIANISGELTTYVDGSGSPADQASRVLSGNPASLTGFPNTGSTVIRFTYSDNDTNPPSITTHPKSMYVLEGLDATLSVVANGTAKYQWTHDGTNILSGTNNTLTISNAAHSNAGTYFVTVSNAFGFAISSNAVLTVIDSEGLRTVAPGAYTGTEGAGASGVINGPAREQIVYLSSHFPAESIWITQLRFRPDVTGIGGNAFTTSESTMQVNMSTRNVLPDNLSTTFANNAGTNNTVVFQGSAFFSSRFSGGTPKDFDMVIPLTTPFLYNPTNGSLVVDIRKFSSDPTTWVDASIASNDGASRVASANPNASTGSTNSIATVLQFIYAFANSNRPPEIVDHPTNTTSLVGGSPVFFVTLTGPEPYFYQWHKNGTNIANATNSSLVIANAEATDSGVYHVVVSNLFGSATSSNATLTIIDYVDATLVVPNGWEPSEAVGYGGVILVSGREQNIYSPIHFPAHPIVITGLRLRPDSTGNPFTNTISDIEISLSTVDLIPDAFSAEYAANVGTNLTVVFDGPAVLSSKFVGPAGGPKSFDIEFPFATPFEYNRDSGSLVVDFKNMSGEGTTRIDAVNSSTDQAGRIISENVEATSGNANSGASIIQLIFHPVSTNQAPEFFIHPQAQAVLAGTDVTLTADASGSGIVHFQWRLNGTNILNATNRFLSLTNVQSSHAGFYSVSASNLIATAVSSQAAIGVYFNPARLQVVGGSYPPSTEITVPIRLVSDGNVASTAFGLDFNETQFEFSGAELGSNALGKSIVIDAGEAGFGRVGIIVTGGPPNLTFQAGTQEIARIHFTIPGFTNNSSSLISFIDQPVPRRVADSNDAPLTVVQYSAASVSVAAGRMEGDPIPRPNGNLVNNAADWTLIGQFAAGLLSPTNASEFQSADNAPRISGGDGRIAATDWVQAARYAAGLDPATLRTGPTNAIAGPGAGPSLTRIVTVENKTIALGETETVRVTFAAQGGENALGFSLSFNPSHFRIINAYLGPDVLAGALILNTNELPAGRLGILFALPPGFAFSAGSKDVFRVDIEAIMSGGASSALTFGDQPAFRETSDLFGNALPTSYADAQLTTPTPAPPLQIKFVNPDVQLTWPVWAWEFQLQSAEILSIPMIWSNVVATPQTNNGMMETFLPTTNTNMFFRLFRP